MPETNVVATRPSGQTSSGSRCFVCAGISFRKLFDKGGQSYFRCRDCGLITIDPLPSVQDLNEFYERDYSNAGGGGALLAVQEQMARATARARLNAVRAHATTGRWLDVGCSTGLFLQEAGIAGLDAEGIDLSAVAVEQAVRKKLKAKTATIEAVNPPRSYDVITGFDVIEHVPDPVGFVVAAHRLLSPGGVLALTTPDTGSLSCRLMGRRWYFYIPTAHLTGFNRNTLSRLLEQHGFEVVSVDRAWKALTYNYTLAQFGLGNPFLYRVWKALGLVVPQSSRDRFFFLSIGEMMVIARKAWSASQR